MLIVGRGRHVHPVLLGEFLEVAPCVERGNLGMQGAAPTSGLYPALTWTEPTYISRLRC